MQSVTLSLFRFGSVSARLWAFAQMATARFALKQVRDLQAFKLCGSGTGEGFTPVPNTSVYAILGNHDIAAMVPQVMAGTTLEFSIATLFAGVEFKLRVDAFGLLFALVSSFLWTVTSAYSIGYMRGLKEHSQTRYY